MLPLHHHQQVNTATTSSQVSVVKMCRSFLSHFLEGLKSNGVNTFMDNWIMKSGSINSELVRAIRESRLAVVILSKNYASSSWCLHELQLIMDCRASLGQTVMTIFYDVEPSNVRKQTGDFGKAFEETCNGSTEEEKKTWRQALTQVALIAGEHLTSWASEAQMISKIIKDVSNELPSTDFDRLVGVEAHVAKLKSMIRLASDEVKMVGILGPAGIGKTTIAKALYNQVSSNFQLNFYKEIFKGKYEVHNLERHDLQNPLKKELLSGILDHRDMKIPDLGEAEERLKHQRFLLILDDVFLHEIKAFRGVIQGLRYGSKVIVTSEDIDTLREFGQRFPPRSYLEHADEVAKLVTPFPLGLRVLGSSLRGKSKDEWITALDKFKTCHGDNDIETVIRFSYEGLSDKQKTLLYLLTDSISSGENVNNAIFSLSRSDWDAEKGFKL